MDKFSSHEKKNESFENRNFEREEILTEIKLEHERRVHKLHDIVEKLHLYNDEIIVAPPVLNRTDFGYSSDLDIIFLGSEEQSEKIYSSLIEEGIFSSIMTIGVSELHEIQGQLPEFYQMLMEKKGNVGSYLEISPGVSKTDFDAISSELENKIRSFPTKEEKVNLREERMKIGKEFMEDIKKRLPVLGFSFSGSMISDMQRFSVNSDIDIEYITTNISGPRENMNLIYWEHYLKWKYAEKFHVKIDSLGLSYNVLHEMALRDGELSERYKRDFGIDLTQKL